MNGITDETLTYRDVGDIVRRVASGLKWLGVECSDIVACISPNSHDFIFVLLGAMCNGAPVATINPSYTACELAEITFFVWHNCNVMGQLELWQCCVYGPTAPAAL